MKSLFIILLVGLIGSSALAQSTQPAMNLNHDALRKLGWQFAVRTDAFGQTPLFDVIDHLHSLTVHHLELSPHQQLSADHTDWLVGPEMKQPEIDALQVKLKQVKMDVVTYNAGPLPPDEAALRKVFEWAQKLKLKTIACEPDPTALPMLDKLANEFKIDVAVISGPAPAQFPTCADVVRAVAGHSPRLGACADVAVWRMGGENPADCVKSMSGRVREVRLRDVGAHGEDFETALRELKSQQFKGVLCAIPSGSGMSAASVNLIESANALSQILTKLSPEK